MTDPKVRRIDTLSELTAVAVGDMIIINDISEINLAEYTKQIKVENIKIFNAAQLSANVVENAQIKDGVVTAGKLATDAVETLKIKDGAVTAAKLSVGLVDAEASNLIYIQLFQPDEIIVSTTGRSFWFVSSFFTGKKVKKMGLGVITPGTSNTTVALGSLGSVAGNAFVEVDKNASLTAGVKHSINITAGSGNPKGLDFWFIVGK